MSSPYLAKSSKTIIETEIDDLDGAKRAGEIFGYPLMRRLAYDGRGNAVAHSEEELSSAIARLQLGRMLCQAASQMAIKVMVLDLLENCPANRWHVFTAEIEHVDVATTEMLEQQGIDDLDGAKRAGEIFGYPLMGRLAYDGRRNAVAHSEEELSSAELAVIVARGRDNSILCYSVVETIHKENICHIVKAPANVSWDIRKHATDVAYKAILLNEVAHGPHNCGHHTIESCYTSQFEQHLRAVVGLPLGEPSMKTPAAVMYNILGEDEEEGSDSQSAVTPRVGIIMGSDSDLPVMKDAARILNMFFVPCEVKIVSAHWTPEMFSYASSALERGIQIIIAGAGGAAHLPGKGVPVATVAINNATNAGLLAVRMMGICDADLLARMSQYQEDTRMMS
ncbi:phosphoribosylaminoimidazole carboxylase [Quercus suber]|uniref:phosphoribosylaminoimidazole carboxylase n=1 Tax=Quercus suber TaxID=58331 RepID=A0AAW0JFZ3_QUESU